MALPLPSSIAEVEVLLVVHRILFHVKVIRHTLIILQASHFIKKTIGHGTVDTAVTYHINIATPNLFGLHQGEVLRQPASLNSI